MTFLLFASIGMLGALGGCTTAGFPIGGTPIQTNKFLTGNWVFTTTSTASPNPFTGLSGFIYAQNPGVRDATTASLQAALSNSSNCYVGASLIPLYGTVTGTEAATAISVRSLSVNGQALQITAKVTDDTLTQLDGTYNISGGCGNGGAGNLTGLRYSNLTGTYAGTLTNNAGQTVSLAVSQTATNGTGSGTFLLSGSANFTGLTCFNSATIPSPATGSSIPASTIIGNMVNITLTAGDGAQVTLAGTIDQKATTFTVSTASVTGDSCAGDLGPATLTLQGAS